MTQQLRQSVRAAAAAHGTRAEVALTARQLLGSYTAGGSAHHITAPMRRLVQELLHTVHGNGAGISDQNLMTQQHKDLFRRQQQDQRHLSAQDQQDQLQLSGQNQQDQQERLPRRRVLSLQASLYTGNVDFYRVMEVLAGTVANFNVLFQVRQGITNYRS